MPIADDLARGHNWLIYGDAGTGKTPLVAGGPKTLIIRSSLDNVRAAVMRGAKAEQWIADDHDELLKVEEYIRHEGHREFDWAWLDTATLFQDMALEDIMTTLVSDKPHRKLWAPDKGEYRDNMNRLMIFLRAMVKAPINFGLTAHVMRTEDREGNEIKVPYIHGKGMWEKTCAMMGLVGYLEQYENDKGEMIRKLHTSNQEYYYAKDSYNGIFKGLVVNPTMPKLLSIVGDTVAKVGDPAPVKKGAGKKAAPVKKAVAKAAPVKTAAKKVAPVKKAVAKKAAVKKTTKKAS